MGSVPAELSLDLRPSSSSSCSSFVPKTITDFLYNLSSLPDKLPKLNDFLARLQDELTKIHAFKRELPLSMLLLNDAISVIKEESEKCRPPRHSPPLFEEFIPLSNHRDHHPKDTANQCSTRDNNKKNWMSSVQLWNNSTSYTVNPKSLSTKKKSHEQEEEEEQSITDERNGGGGGGRKGFMPFSTHACSSSSSVPVKTVAVASAKQEKEETLVIDKLSLLTPPVKTFREACASRGSRTSSSNNNSNSNNNNNNAPLHHQHIARKQRRCWSPELHRRFVNALHKLGGSQAATPKQIRELMQVDGLTNDEVKSHLQKYRLHTRRVPPASANQPVVVLGGLWMSQDQYNNDSSKVSSSGSGSPQSPLHLAAGSRGGTSPTEGDSMEDDEDAKSESYSWKSHMHRPGKVDV